MRLFLALDLDESIREKIIRFLDDLRGSAPDARWVRPESLHVTLKFVGPWPDQRLPEMQRALRTVHFAAFEIHLRDYGFFPAPEAPRVFWIGIHGGSHLSSLAAAIDAQIATLGVAREEHPFTPHLTLARRSGGSGVPGKNDNDRFNRTFTRLQEKLAITQPNFGAMTARQFFLYRSELSPTGSRYTKLFAFPLT